MLMFVPARRGVELLAIPVRFVTAGRPYSAMARSKFILMFPVRHTILRPTQLVAFVSRQASSILLMAPDIGNIALPQIGEAGVGRLNGFVTNNGSSVSNNRVLFEIFQRDASRTTSSGYPMKGFSVVRNNNDGYYNTGALPNGSYIIYVTDTQTGRKILLDGINVYHLHERIDFRLEQSCFGISGPVCTVLN